VRIVLDTNVVISALLWRGPPYRVFQAARQQDRLRLFTSPALIEELAEVLLRPGPTKRLALIGRTARQVLTDYLEAVELLDPPPLPAPISRDPDDDAVLALAAAAKADLIVSGDADLLVLDTHAGIPIRTPAQALSLITG
jgi:putative PIN family toxin of toxin-antitoxin system